jgi:hypothetical protein
LRAEPGLLVERDLPDQGIARANVLIRLESSAAEGLAAYEDALRPLIEQRGGELYSRTGNK